VRILVYQNPDAGHDRVLPEEVVERLQRAGHEVDWTSTKQHRLSDPEIRAFDLVVAAGGDGSVGRTARQLVGSTVPIAVLPLGTANNLASTLDAGKHDLDDRINEWAILPFDAGVIEFDRKRDWFFEGFGIGAFAEAAAKVTEEDRQGKVHTSREAELVRDIAALQRQSQAQPPIKAEVHLDDRVIYVSVVMLEVLNIGLLGPNVELTADVNPSDGFLDVVFVEEPQRPLLTEFLAATKAGQRPAAPFNAIRAREIRVKLESSVAAHLDGSILQLSAPVDVRLGVQPHAVHFLGGSSR
jgi:diacylglycerol kinase family enzyme